MYLQNNEFTGANAIIGISKTANSQVMSGTSLTAGCCARDSSELCDN